CGDLRSGGGGSARPGQGRVGFRVRAVLDSGLPVGAATVAVRTMDGRSLRTTVLHAKGSMEHPLSDAELDEKVRDLVRYGSFRGDVEAIIAATWKIDTLTTIDTL